MPASLRIPASSPLNLEDSACKMSGIGCITDVPSGRVPFGYAASMPEVMYPIESAMVFLYEPTCPADAELCFAGADVLVAPMIIFPPSLDGNARFPPSTPTMGYRKYLARH